jgi:hypothetical protein
MARTACARDGGKGGRRRPRLRKMVGADSRAPCGGEVKGEVMGC